MATKVVWKPRSSRANRQPTHTRSRGPAPSNGTTVNNTWVADVALTRSGWARDVVLEARDGRFTAVEPVGTGCSAPDATERIRGIVVPAIPNLHSHAFQRGLVGRTEIGTPPGVGHDQRDDFWSWRTAMYDFVGRLDPEAVEAVAALVYSEMLRAGYGTVVEFHYVHHAPSGQPYADPLELSRRLIQAANRTGIRLTLIPVVYEAAGFGGLPLESAQRRFALTAEEAVAAVETLRGDSAGPTCSFGVGVHSLRAAPPAALSHIADWAADQPGLPVHLHIAEQPAEVEACLAWSGARPVEWLLDNAPVDARWCAVHATHLDEQEVARLASTGAVVALCPTTEANLGDGLFPLPAFEASGGLWGVGSDSQVSVSPSDELRTLEYGQRLTLGRRIIAGQSSSDPHSNGRALVESVVRSGAQATGHPLRGLAVGGAADLVVLDPDHHRLADLQDDGVIDAWIFGSESDAVRHVMVGGSWVVRDGRPTHWDTTVQRYRSTIRRLTANL